MEPVPPLEELGRDDPAVANLLLHRGDPNGDVLPAIVLDLASRGYLEIEAIGRGRHLYRLTDDGDVDALKPYERRALDLIAERAVHGTLPAEPVAIGVDEETAEWWDALVGEVSAEAVERGFVRDRDVGVALMIFFGFACLATIALFVLAEDHDSTTLRICAGAMFGLVFLAALFIGDDDIARDRWRLTPTGRDRSRWWGHIRDRLNEDHNLAHLPAASVVVWDEYLAYAAALGLARAACHDLPVGPDGGSLVWVWRQTMWRELRVRYPRWLPPGWGRAPWMVGLGSIAAIAIGGYLLARGLRPGVWHPAPPFSDAVADIIGDLEPAIVAVAGCVTVVALWALVNASLDFVRSRVDVEGEIVARAIHHGHRWNPWADLVPRSYFVVVDDGASDRLRGVHLSPGEFDRLWRGHRVRLRCTPRLGHVTEVVRLAEQD